MNRRFSGAGLFLLTAWLALLVLVMVRGTLGLPYLSDDFEHGQVIAQIRAGLEPGRDLILLPFHGQVLVLLRLLFWFGTLAGGMNLTLVRLGVSAAHIAGAVGCAVLCTRWTGSRFTGWLAGTLYAGALGFVGEQIWWPSSGIFCLGVTFFIFALAALDADRVWLCVAMLALAALGLNGILIAALGLPIYHWLVWGRRPRIILWCAMAALLAVGFWHAGISVRGLGLGAWLVLTAPLRFFSAWTTFALPGFQTIWKLAPFAWLPLLAAAWFMSAHYRRILLAVWTPAILLAMLVGMARADYPYRFGPGSLYTADRYYYFFLFPLVVHCVLFLSTFKTRPRAVALLTILAGAALIASHRRYLANVPRGTFDASARALERGRLLVETIRSSAIRPLVLADRRIPLDGARNNSVTLAFLIYSEYPRGIAGVHVVKQPAAESLATSRIDFKNASYEEALTSGFSWWEPPFRWMGASGSLHLSAAPGDLVISAYAPVDQLHRTIHVTVTVNGKAIGKLAISQTGTLDYRLEMPVLTPGSTVNITLTSDFVWHARDIFPDSFDERDLSIALSAVGFDMRP